MRRKVPVYSSDVVGMMCCVCGKTINGYQEAAYSVTKSTSCTTKNKSRIAFSSKVIAFHKSCAKRQPTENNQSDTTGENVSN